MGCATVLVAVGWQQRRLVPQMLSAFANIGLNIWAIPRWGIEGAAHVYVASEVVLFIGYAFWVGIYYLQGQKSRQ